MGRFAATLAIAVALLVSAAPAVTQTATKLPRVAIICVPSCSGVTFDALLDELRKLGWVENTTISLELRESGSRLDQLPLLAADVVRSKPDLIVAFTPQAVRAVKDATSDIPIVMLFVADPVGVGLASSLAHPGGNLTGVATLVPGAFIGKMLEVLRELLPHARRVAAFLNPSSEALRLLFPREAPPAAAKLGFQLDAINVRDPKELPEAIARAKAAGGEALWIVGDPIFHSPPNLVPDLAAQAGLPSMYLVRNLVQAGGLISYGPDFPSEARRGAHYVDRLLKGTRSEERRVGKE